MAAPVSWHDVRVICLELSLLDVRSGLNGSDINVIQQGTRTIAGADRVAILSVAELEVNFGIRLQIDPENVPQNLLAHSTLST